VAAQRGAVERGNQQSSDAGVIGFVREKDEVLALNRTGSDGGSTYPSAVQYLSRHRRRFLAVSDPVATTGETSTRVAAAAVADDPLLASH
jgi:hypothetical protein